MLHFSFIIPVYNRPDEVDELLNSLQKQTYKNDFEVVNIEDGSTLPCLEMVDKYKSSLNISYFFKENSGPGASRNYGMQRAQGNYFIILDSDCVLPETYLQNVNQSLSKSYVDCFGGPDAALDTFSPTQKAINFAMTSVVTTGGIRGASEHIEKFQPRSFNMGISKNAFEKSEGFGKIHPGEDPDLSIRLWKLGFKTTLLSSAFVYHKRRIDWKKFKLQVSKFGKARPILNQWHPEYAKITYWFPSVFIVGLVFSIVFALFGFLPFIYLYSVYFLMVFMLSAIQNKSFYIALLSIFAVFIQFWGYGWGFLESFFKLNILKLKPEIAFPKLFFK